MATEKAAAVDSLETAVAVAATDAAELRMRLAAAETAAAARNTAARKIQAAWRGCRDRILTALAVEAVENEIAASVAEARADGEKLVQHLAVLEKAVAAEAEAAAVARQASEGQMR